MKAKRWNQIIERWGLGKESVMQPLTQPSSRKQARLHIAALVDCVRQMVKTLNWFSLTIIELDRRLRVANETWTRVCNEQWNRQENQIQALQKDNQALRRELETRNYACGDVLCKLWQDVVIEKHGDWYGDWDVPGEVYTNVIDLYRQAQGKEQPNF